MRLLIPIAGILLLVTLWTVAADRPRGVPPEMSGGYLALGDSYTIGESVEPGERYPVQVLQAAGIAEVPDIIATTGWTTGDLIRALSNRQPPMGYQAVSLLIGVNNQYQGRSPAEYREQFIILLKAAIALAGNRPAHVIVLSIPDYSVTPWARDRGHGTAWIAAQIDSFNTINHSLALEYGVHYLDVTAESRKAAADPSLIAGDGLHFSGKEYGIWARLMAPVMKSIWK